MEQYLVVISLSPFLEERPKDEDGMQKEKKVEEERPTIFEGTAPETLLKDARGQDPVEELGVNEKTFWFWLTKFGVNIRARAG
jgi:hypothetical protein